MGLLDIVRAQVPRRLRLLGTALRRLWRAQPDQIQPSAPAPQAPAPTRTGLVLSGGGARAAYQVGALKALLPFLAGEHNPFSVIVGSSVGAINGLILGACLKKGMASTVAQLEQMWRVRTFRNTFAGSPSRALFRAVRMAILQYLSPGPRATDAAIFDPNPLMAQVDEILRTNGGLLPENRAAGLHAVAVMTTMEGPERKPLLFLSAPHYPSAKDLEGASFAVCSVPDLSAKHGFASAALPSVLPPVELDVEGGTVRLVDGGISQNIPVDPAVRLGAQRVIVLDVSGRDWWLDRNNQAQDTRPQWEVPATPQTFCMLPPEKLALRCRRPLGPLLKEIVCASRSKFLAALGPVWPVYLLLSRRLGEEIAYEAMSYVALDGEYLEALIERGYNETLMVLQEREGSWAANPS